MSERMQVTIDGYTLALDDRQGVLSAQEIATGLAENVRLMSIADEATRALIIAHDRALQSLASLSAGITVEVSRKVWERDQARLGELEQENATLRKALESIAGRECWNAAEAAIFALVATKDHDVESRIQDTGGQHAE